MTECNQTAFPFEGHFSRRVEARFDGSAMTTDDGALLLRAVERKIRLPQRVAACFTDVCCTLCDVWPWQERSGPPPRSKPSVYAAGLLPIKSRYEPNCIPMLVRFSSLFVTSVLPQQF